TFTDADVDGPDGTASVEDVLPAGRQLVIADVIAHVRASATSRGAALAPGDRVGTLRVVFDGLSEPGAAAVTLRTPTAVEGGRAGLAYAGLHDADLLDGAAWVCGLRQNDEDRSNVAVQNAGSASDGAVTLRLTALSSDGRSIVLAEPALAPGKLFQVS